MTNGLEKHEEALECFDKAHKIDPDEKKVYLNIANTYQEIKDYDKAISFFDKAIEKDPNWTAAIFDKAVTYEREIHDKEKADECFKQVIKIKRLLPNLLLLHWILPLLINFKWFTTVRFGIFFFEAVCENPIF